jgi:hypothetical protein
MSQSDIGSRGLAAGPQADRKLRLAHLLLWITLTGLYLAVLRTNARVVPGIIGTVIATAAAAFAGIAGSGLAIVTWRRVRGVRLPTEPGEWLLFVLGVIFVLDVAKTVWPERTVVYPAPIAAALSCLATVVPMLSRRLEPAWKGFFGVMVILQATTLVMLALQVGGHARAGTQILIAVNRVQFGAACMVPAVVSAWEARRGSHRSWMHWLGVGMYSLWMSLLLWTTL